MTIQLFGYPGFPNDIGITKIDVPPNECAFFLDFQRPLKKIRWLGVLNHWVGSTVSLVVPVAHASALTGGYVVSVSRGDPYFMDIQQLWKKHRGSKRKMISDTQDGLRVIADFGTHFPENC